MSVPDLISFGNGWLELLLTSVNIDPSSFILQTSYQSLIQYPVWIDTGRYMSCCYISTPVLIKNIHFIAAESYTAWFDPPNQLKTSGYILSSVAADVLLPMHRAINSLQNKVWNLPDRSTILPRFIYGKEGKPVRPTPFLPVSVRGMALILNTASVPPMLTK